MKATRWWWFTPVYANAAGWTPYPDRGVASFGPDWIQEQARESAARRGAFVDGGKISTLQIKRTTPAVRDFFKP